MKRKKILFVCTGNTCRSPMAEAILRSKIKKQKIKWWDVSSCGIFAEVGGSVSPLSMQALEEAGFTLTQPECDRQKLCSNLYDRKAETDNRRLRQSFLHKGAVRFRRARPLRTGYNRIPRHTRYARAGVRHNNRKNYTRRKRRLNLQYKNLNSLH